jgi:AraC-like DNA-binding protein
MKRAHSIEDFVANPVGRYQIGRTHLVWCHSAALCGSVHWGRPTDADAAALVRRLEICRHPAMAGGFDNIIDARAMESFDWPAFGVVSDFVRRRLTTLDRLVRKHAILVPPGLVGALVAGLLPLLGPSYPMRFFPTAEEAQAWIDRPELAVVLDEALQLADDARGLTPLLRSLRHRLDGALKHASVTMMASALGIAPRTLQRELERHKTSFRLELTRARVRTACLMLETSNDKIEAIARHSGWGTSSQMISVFRRHLGETPAVYRARHRTAANPGAARKLTNRR